MYNFLPHKVTKRLSLLICFLLILSISYTNHSSYVQAAKENVSAKAPQNLRLTEGALTHNSAGFEWDFIGTDQDPENPNDIEVWNADTDEYITWGNLWTRAVGGLEPETTYRIYITWYERPATKLHKSNVLEFTTTADNSEYKNAPLAAPLNLQVSNISDSAITFTWNGSPGADGYDFYANGNWAGGVWDGSNRYIFPLTKELKSNGTSLSFMVGAQKTVGGALEVSEKSNVVQFDWGKLKAPQDLQTITVNRTTAALAWAPVAGASSYDIYKDGNFIGSTTENRYQASDLREGVSYSFFLKARNDLWTSEASNTVTTVPGADYNNVAYYTAWSVYERKFNPSDIDIAQVTHINYAFADLCWQKSATRAAVCEDESLPLQNGYVYDGEIILGDPDVDPANIKALNLFKKEKPDLKVLISAGGWSWSKNFSNMADNEITRRSFADSVVKLLRTYELDGIDIDWEYPVEGGETYNSNRPEDKENFTLLMKIMRETLDSASREDGKYYLLTIASGQNDSFVINADLAKSSAYLDFINIMTYDFGGNWEKIGTYNAPIYYDSASPKKSAARSNVRGGAIGHLNGGVPNYKLVLGIPFYGKGWAECEAPGQYAACSSVSAGTWESGLYDFSDIEENYINKNGYERYWNEKSKIAYLFNGENKTYLTYNDEISMLYSTSLVKTLDLAGVMSWDISGDRNKTLNTKLNEGLPTTGIFDKASLAAPNALNVTRESDSSVTLDWDTVNGAAEYEVFINDEFAGKTETNSFTLSNMKEGAVYKAYVFSVRKNGGQIIEVSPASQALNITVGQHDPTTLQTVDELTPYWMKPQLTAHLLTVERLGIDSAYKLTDRLGKVLYEHTILLNSEKINLANSTGIAYLPYANELRTVEPVFITNEDGTITASILLPSGSFFTVAEMLEVELPAFQDDLPQWAAIDIYRALGGLITTGQSETIFGAGTHISRGAFTATVMKGLGVLPDYSEQPFADTPLRAAYTGDIASAKKLGLISGKPNGNFDPESTITRQEMAVVLVNAWKLTGKQATASDHALKGFTDLDTVADYAKNSLAFLNEQGIIKGVSSTQLSPRTNVTKAQAVAALVRLLDNIDK